MNPRHLQGERAYQMPIGIEPPRTTRHWWLQQPALNHHVPLDTGGRNGQQVPIWLHFLINKEQRGPNAMPPARHQPNPTILSIHPAPSPPLCDPTTKIIAFNFRTSLEYERLLVLSWSSSSIFTLDHIRQGPRWPNNWPIRGSSPQHGLASMSIIFRHQRQPVISTKGGGKA